jgi:glycosyltransferase involved in cell wall biosynthesis
MKVTVVIPAYNSAPTIREALDSVLGQTATPDEILVVNDGSTDQTASILNSYGSRVTVINQENKGVASARNTAVERAQGSLIAFLDADDVWHPSYLEVQRNLFKAHPDGVAFFTGHVNFCGYRNYAWGRDVIYILPHTEVMDPLSFSRRYNTTTGPFASMSYCCIPKRTFEEVGPEPFSVKVSGADDYYLFNIFPLLGSVVYTSAPLVAYRVTGEAQSANRLKGLAWSVGAFELLQKRYDKVADAKLAESFGMAFASTRRQYAKVLLGAGKTSEAREQLWHSLAHAINPQCLAKSLGLLSLSYLPSQLQPAWPSSYRKVEV